MYTVPLRYTSLTVRLKELRSKCPVWNILRCNAQALYDFEIYVRLLAFRYFLIWWVCAVLICPFRCTDSLEPLNVIDYSSLPLVGSLNGAFHLSYSSSKNASDRTITLLSTWSTTVAFNVPPLYSKWTRVSTRALCMSRLSAWWSVFVRYQCRLDPAIP